MTDKSKSTCLGNIHSASDTARRRFCSMTNIILDSPTSSFQALTKLRNRVSFWGRNSSELSCMSSAAGGQSSSLDSLNARIIMLRRRSATSRYLSPLPRVQELHTQ